VVKTVFRENDRHLHAQASVLDTFQWLDSRIQKKLEKSWAPIFYHHVFCKIDEKPFAVLYDTGAPIEIVRRYIESQGEKL